MNTKNELDEIFIDVRKAYRLLYFYQRRIMDTADFISNLLSLNVVSGYSLYSSNPPKNGSNLDIDRWAWDWLNMYSYEFNLGYLTYEKNKYQIAIAFNADSGFYEADKSVTGIDVERFPAVEDCTTNICLYVGKNTWKPDDFEFNWGKFEKDDFVKIIDQDKSFIAKKFNLSDFADEISIRKNVSNFKQLIRENQITELWEEEN